MRIHIFYNMFKCKEREASKNLSPSIRSREGGEDMPARGAPSPFFT